MSTKKFCVVAAAIVLIGAGIYWWPSSSSVSIVKVEEPTALDAGTLAGGPARVAGAAVDDASPTPPHDREELADASADASRSFSIRVIDEQGHPLPGRHVFAWTNRFTHRAAETDENGEARIEDLAGVGDLLVMHDGQYPIWRRAIELGRRHEVIVPDGLELRGRVRVDGRVPAQRIALQLSVRRDLRNAMPQSLFRYYVRRHRGSHSAWIQTDADGRFTFRGLPENWKGRLSFPTLHTLDPDGPLWNVASGHDGVVVGVQTQDISLDLLVLPHRSCRLVYADNEEPVVPAGVVCWPKVRGHATTISTWVVDEHGRFEVVARPARAQDMELFRDPKRRPKLETITIWVTYSQTKKTVRITPQDLARPGELLIRVPRVTLTEHEFRVVDVEGRPIQGAILGNKTVSARTDADGKGRISLLDGRPGALLLAARGFAFRDLSAPLGTGPLEFVLERGNRLRVTVRGPNTGGLRLVMAYGKDPFMHNARRHLGKIHRALMVSPRDGSSSWGRGWYAFGLDAAGAVDLYDLDPATPFRLEMHDTMGSAAAGLDIPGVGPHEEREVSLEVSRTGAVIRAKVTDTSGTPIRGARVTISFVKGGSGTRRPPSKKTDAEGRAMLPPLFAALGELCATVVKAGYATESIAGLDGKTLEVRLERATTVVVEVVDDSGAAVDVESVWIKEAKGKVRPLSPGRFELAGILPGNVEVHARFGCRVLVQRANSQETPIRFVVPRVGRLRFDRPLGAKATRIELVPAQGGESCGLRFLPKDGRLICELPTMLPGHYQLRFANSEKVPMKFEVRAGETTQVKIGR